MPRLIKIVNPKLHSDSSEAKERRLFPYYAGYSAAFAENCLATLGLPLHATVLDPWNGSGTTTKAAHHLGFHAVGLDLNPVMVLAAKAAFVSALDAPSLVPLAHAIVEAARARSARRLCEPLMDWFSPSSAAIARSIEREINRALISHSGYRPLNDSGLVGAVSPLAAVLYVALFRILRQKAQTFFASNPTWIRRPRGDTKISLSRRDVEMSFLAEVELVATRMSGVPALFRDESSQPSIAVANAESLPLENGSVDAVVTSPPYCTRIDYAVTTSIELAVLDYDADAFDRLRRSLTGTSTVAKSAPEVDRRWGPTCTKFLKSVAAHSSYASSTYYLKSHASYFSSLYRSLVEIQRVLRPGGYCVLVVQNSYYKEHLNDVAQIATEMASSCAMKLKQRADFESKKSMVRVNPGARRYARSNTSVESVLCFRT